MQTTSRSIESQIRGLEDELDIVNANLNGMVYVGHSEYCDVPLAIRGLRAKKRDILEALLPLYVAYPQYT